MKKRIAGKAGRIALAAGLLLGTTLVLNAKTTHAEDPMGCYGWFDYVYKVTGDLNFANYHFLVCRGEIVAPKIHKAGEETPIITIDPNTPFTPAAPGGSVISPPRSIAPREPVVTPPVTGTPSIPSRGGLAPRPATP